MGAANVGLSTCAFGDRSPSRFWRDAGSPPKIISIMTWNVVCPISDIRTDLCAVEVRPRWRNARWRRFCAKLGNRKRDGLLRSGRVRRQDKPHSRRRRVLAQYLAFSPGARVAPLARGSSTHLSSLRLCRHSPFWRSKGSLPQSEARQRRHGRCWQRRTPSKRNSYGNCACQQGPKPGTCP